MSATVNARIQLKRDTTANWNAARGFVPMAGEIIIYTDYSSYQKEVNGRIKTILIPGIKIGVHVTLGEKIFWNNKINVDDAYEAVHDELIDEMLVLNRN